MSLYWGLQRLASWMISTVISLQEQITSLHPLLGAATANKVTVNGEEFGNYGPLDLFRRHNCFSILIETPVRPPFSFFNQKAFYNERFFMDTRRRVVDVALINVLQTLIQQKIPAGAGYRLLVKGFDGINALSIAQQESELNKQLNRNC